jgi:hypothetical protein
VNESALALTLGVSAADATHASTTASAAEQGALKEMERLRREELKAASSLVKLLVVQMRSARGKKQRAPVDAQWFWEDGSSGSGQWQPFDFTTRDMLTAGYMNRAKQPKLALTHGYFASAGGYSINFSTMKQQKLSSGYERNIKAVVDGVTVSSETSPEDIVKQKLVDAKANVKRLATRGVATLRHGWEWQHSDGSWRPFEPHISRTLFDERAAGNAVVKIDLCVQDGMQRIFEDAPHLVIDPRAEQTELFIGLQNFRGNMKTPHLRKQTGQQGVQKGLLGSRRKDSLRSLKSFDISQYAIVDQIRGVSTRPILSFSGHFVFKSADDFLTIKLGTTGEQKAGRFRGFTAGAAFVIGCMMQGWCRKQSKFKQSLVTGNTRSSPSYTCGNILVNEKLTFEVLWDGHSGSIHLWSGFAELAGPYSNRPAADGKGHAVYLGQSPVAPNAGAGAAKRGAPAPGRICLFNRETSKNHLEVSQLRLAVYRDPTMAIEAAHTAAADALAASKRAVVPPPTGAVIVDMSASPMQMRDPLSRVSSPLRAFYLDELVEEALAPSEFRLTLANPTHSDPVSTTHFTTWPGSASVIHTADGSVRFSSFATCAFPQLASKVDPVYYEVKIVSDFAVTQLGFATNSFVCSKSCGVGDDANSWGFDGRRLKLWHKPYPNALDPSPRQWIKGDVIGFLYTPTMGTIEVSTNGRKHNIVARNVPKGCFPAITHKGGVLHCNMSGRGVTPFAFAPAADRVDLSSRTPLLRENLPIGTAVARGPHWTWGDQDGGEGSVGRTTSTVDGLGWVTVQWANGTTRRYRIGAELRAGGTNLCPQFDLVLVNCSTTAAPHSGGCPRIASTTGAVGSAWWLASAEEQAFRLASRVEPVRVGGALERKAYARGSNEGREAALEYVAIAEHILLQERAHRLGAAREGAVLSASSSADNALGEARFVHLLTGERTSASALEARGIPASAVVESIKTFSSLTEHCGLGLYRVCSAKSNGRPIYLNVNGRYMAYYSKSGEWTVAQRKLVSEALEAASGKGGIDTLTGSDGDREQEPGPPVFRASNASLHPLPEFTFNHEGGWVPASGVMSNHPEASKAEILQAIINRDSQGGEAERWARRAHEAAASCDHAVPDWADEASTSCDAVWEWNKGADGKLIVKGETNDTTRWRRFDAVSTEILTNAYVRRLKNIALPHLRYPISVNLYAMHSVREDTGWITPVRGFVAGFPAVGGIEETRRPHSWFPQRVRTIVVDVDPASAEWTEVTSRFCAHADDLAPRMSSTMELPEARVLFHSIQRIQNAPLFDVFEMKRRQIAERNGVDNERTLFHATGDVDPAEMFSSRHGFDPRKNASSVSQYPMALDGDLGQAAYFSTSAAAIQELAHRTIVGARSAMQMFMCRVVCGKSAAVTGKAGQKFPDDGAGNGRSYDSHTGYPQSPCGGARGFAIFDAMQAYPEYLVTFNAPEPLDLTDDVVESAVFHNPQDWADAFTPVTASAPSASVSGAKVQKKAQRKKKDGVLTGRDIPASVRWSSSERGLDIVLKNHCRKVTRSTSVLWGTQATELLPPTSFMLGLDVWNNSSYLIIGVGPKQWKWAASKGNNTAFIKRAGCHWFASDGGSSLTASLGYPNVSKAIKGHKKNRLTLIFNREVSGAHTMAVTRKTGKSATETMWTFPIPDECVLFATLGGTDQRVIVNRFTPGTGVKRGVDVRQAFTRGQLVRVKQELAQPSMGWQGSAVDHNAIGFVAGFTAKIFVPSTESEDLLVIHFPNHSGFLASTSDVDILHEVAGGGEAATKVVAPEDTWRLRTSGPLAVRTKATHAKSDYAAAAREPQRPYGQTWWRYRCVQLPVSRSAALVAPAALTNYWTWATAQKGSNIDFTGPSNSVMRFKGGVGGTEGARGDQGWTVGVHTWTMRFKSGTGACGEAWALLLVLVVVSTLSLSLTHTHTHTHSLSLTRFTLHTHRRHARSRAGTHGAVGLCTGRASLSANSYTHVLGADGESWGWHKDGEARHAGTKVGSVVKFAQDEDLTLCLDLRGATGTLALSKGGVLSYTFTGIPKTSPLYPCAATPMSNGRVAIVSSTADTNSVVLWSSPAMLQPAVCAGIFLNEEIMVVERTTVMKTTRKGFFTGMNLPIVFFKLFDKSSDATRGGRDGKWVAASNFADAADLFELVEEIAGPDAEGDAGGAATKSARSDEEYVDVQAPLMLKSPHSDMKRFGTQGSYQVRRVAHVTPPSPPPSFLVRAARI